MSVISFIERSARSARLLTARSLPSPVKTILKTGPLHMIVNALDQLEGRMFSLGLPSRTKVEVSAECRTASARLSIIVPIHDAPLVTSRCLGSLERYATMSEIILVDDGSRMAETTRMVQEFSDRNGWSVIRNEKPGGHSAACAAGARLANRPYLCLLNSDTVVTPWCWQAIREAFDTDSSIGIAGPCTSFSGGNEQTSPIAFKCRFRWNDNQICAYAVRLNVAPLQPVVWDLPWIAGFALFIRRSLWEDLGGFDPNLTDYANEIELCKRIAKSGCRLVWVRNAYIHHFGGQSYGKLMTAPEIKSRNFAGLQYIHNKHNPQSSKYEVNNGTTRNH